MSSALDEDTRQSLAAGRETAGDMLRAAQKDLQKVFVVWLVGFLGTFYALRLYVWPFLKRVTEAKMEASLAGEVKIIAQTPFDVILLQAKIGLVAGVLVALPVFLYYSRDALKARGYWPQGEVSLWKAVPVALLGTALFVGGVVYGYAVFFPFTFEFLAANAVNAGFKPTYSIVMWAQFIFLLSMSFGLAAELPLLMSALSYAEIVPYETFRDYWRHAVVLIFAFGALFSPPDPFTQIMWAFPLLALYGGSLYLAKLVTAAKRGSAGIDARALVRERWNLLAGAGVAAGAGTYFFYARGGVAAVNGALAGVSSYRLLPAGSTLPLSPAAAAAVYAVLAAAVGAGAALLYVLVRAMDTAAGPAGDPTAVDIGELDAAGVRAAPPEAFAALDEEAALEYANRAIDDGDEAKARAVLDRFDEAQEADGAGDGDAAEADDGTGIADRASRAGDAFLEEMNEGEDGDGNDIGGYYRDLQFILESLTSKSFRIVAVFLTVLVSVFAWLYTGGIGRVKRDFLRRLPAAVADPESVGVIALHPVEALIFEVKFSTLIAALAVLPMVAYYAWPALRERGFVRGRQQVIFGWTAALLAGLFAGFAVGYAYVAPTAISYLVGDAARADIVISYRITNFFWLIFFTTAGIGLLADIPVLMVLLNTAGVSYRSMRDRWREVTVGVMAFAAVFTPASVSTMVGLTLPLMAAYGLGLGVLFLLTLGGHRDLSRWFEVEGA